jgi:hypothetical protein
MKHVFFVVMLMPCLVVADWRLNAIYNESDLDLDGAYRLGEGGKRKSTYMDKKIKAAQPKPVIMIDYKILTRAQTQGYLCIVSHDPHGEKFELFFDSQSSHSLKWHRTKTKIIAKEQGDNDSNDDTSLYARVFLKPGFDIKARKSYEEYAELDLIIRGKEGVYTLELSEVAR